MKIVALAIIGGIAVSAPIPALNLSLFSPLWCAYLFVSSILVAAILKWATS